jgi:hypothetical protein
VSNLLISGNYSRRGGKMRGGDEKSAPKRSRNERNEKKNDFWTRFEGLLS